MFKFLAILFVSVLAFANATEVRRCSKGQPFPMSVEVEGCSEMPCTVIKGTSAVMNVAFAGTRDNIQSLHAKVRATAMGITVPYLLPKEVADVCSNLAEGGSCPVDKDEDLVYNFEFHVASIYPEIPVSVEVSLKDENNESVACFVTDIKVSK